MKFIPSDAYIRRAEREKDGNVRKPMEGTIWQGPERGLPELKAIVN